MTLRLAEGLRGLGCRVSLVLFQAQGASLGEVPEGVERVDLGGRGDLLAAPWQVPRVVARLARWLDMARPDALIASKEQANTVALWARRRATWGGPVILTRHVPLGVRARLLYRTVHREAEAVVAVSAALADSLRQRMEPGRVHQLPTAVLGEGWERSAATPVAHRWREGGAPLLVCVGRLHRQKGQDLLLEAMVQVPEARLLLVGEGPERAALSRQIGRLGLGARVEQVGAVPDAMPWLAAADLCVVPSRYEGLPTVIIEVLACGVPVLAADCPTGPRELLPPSRLVPPEDPHRLAAGITQVLRDRSPTPFDPDPYTSRGAAARWLELLSRMGAPPAAGAG